MKAVLVNLAFDKGKRHAVIGRGDNQRAVELARGFQDLQRLANLRVAPLDLDGIIGQIAANNFSVGQKCRDLDLFQLLPQPHAGVVFIRSMRLVKAHPEAKRLVLRSGLEKLAKVSGIVLRTDAGRGDGLTQLVKARPRWIACSFGRSAKIAWSPTLARQTN